MPLELPPALLNAVMRAAASAGLPPGAWAGLVIESERVLDLFIDGSGQKAAYLDERAKTPAPPIPGGAKRLAEFAKALRTARPTAPPRSAFLNTGHLVVLSPYTSATAWRLAAIEAGMSVDEWAITRLERLPSKRTAWEAAAAERGQTLAEWILAQAARR